MLGILIWVVYRYLVSVDYQKIFPKFKIQSKARANLKEVQAVNDYWKQKLDTKVVTCTDGLPEQPKRDKALDKLVKDIAEVLFFKYVILSNIYDLKYSHLHILDSDQMFLSFSF